MRHPSTIMLNVCVVVMSIVVTVNVNEVESKLRGDTNAALVVA